MITSDNVEWVYGALIVGDYPLKKAKFADDADSRRAPAERCREPQNTPAVKHTLTESQHTSAGLRRCPAFIIHTVQK